MNYYPALLDLRNRLVLVVGGGEVAARKVASFLETGALVRLVAPELCPQAYKHIHAPEVEYRARAFEEDDMNGAALVVCATDRQEVNKQVYGLSVARGLFCNVVDQPDLCSFIVPAVVRRGELTVAVSTGGASPAAARRLRQSLQKQFGPEWGVLLRIMRLARRKITNQGKPAEENRPLFYQLVDSDLLSLVSAGDAAGVDALLERVLGPGFSLAELGVAADELPAPGEGS